MWIFIYIAYGLIWAKIYYDIEGYDLDLELKVVAFFLNTIFWPALIMLFLINIRDKDRYIG